MECQVRDTLGGTSISHYSIGSLIGAGGMGKVYAARDEHLCRAVAIKVVEARASGIRCPLAAEARILARLNHPNVAAVYEFIREGNTEFLVMEFVPGSTVRELLANGPLPIPEVIRLGGQMARGLSAVHEARLVHRDIKPENLKVTSAGELKILDFGVAQALPSGVALDASTIGSAEVVELAGTLPYMAPEQLLGEEADERSDVYSAGAVLYEMACGRRAFAQWPLGRLIDAILHEEPPNLCDQNAEIPAFLGRAVAKALAKAPRGRHQSAGELLADLAPATLPVGRTGQLAAVTQWLWGLLA